MAVVTVASVAQRAEPVQSEENTRTMSKMLPTRYPEAIAAVARRSRVLRLVDDLAAMCPINMPRHIELADTPGVRYEVVPGGVMSWAIDGRIVRMQRIP